jgi:hypothetical protein
MLYIKKIESCIYIIISLYRKNMLSNIDKYYPKILTADSSYNIQKHRLPKNISLKQAESNYVFIYNKKKGENRVRIEMPSNSYLTISQNLALFQKKIKEENKQYK